MKQKILKTLALGLLLVGGVNGAWADGITPTLDVFFRTNNTNDGWNTNKWNEKSYPIKGSAAGDIEFAAHHSARMFVLQKYTVEHLDAVKSLTLTLTGSSGTDALAIWAFDTNDWTESTIASTLASKVESIVGLALGSTSGSANTTYLKNQQNTKTEVATGINACTFVISGTALETLKANASDNTFTLLITNKVGEITTGNSDRKFYSSGHSTESYRPTLTVTYDAVGVTYGDGTMANYSTFDAARSAVVSAAKDATITVMEDQNITNRVNAISNKTLNIVAAKDDITLTNTMSNQLSFLANGTNNGTINVGSAAHSIIIKNASETTNAIVEVSGTDQNAIVNLTNVTFKDITSSNASGFIKTNNDKAKVTLTDVTFDGCTASATDAGIIFCSANGMVTLSGNLTFTDCTGHHFRVKGRLEESSFNANQVYTIYNESIDLGSSAVIKMNAANRGKYELVNEDRCLVGKGNTGTSNEELVVSEAYTLSVSAANASTLIIPFATTIPDGVEAYTLTYSSGDHVTATLVKTTLPANTPVLINATGSAEGTKYKFNASARATSATPASTSESHTDGALTGVYAETAPGTGHYILTNHGGSVGFRKTVATSKVKAYRAYLTAAAGSREFLDIDFSDGNVTAIKNVKVGSEDHVYYDLQGRRVLYPKKGLYIVNGKKVIIK